MAVNNSMKNRRAFTLIEVLVAIALIFFVLLLLSPFVLPVKQKNVQDTHKRTELKVLERQTSEYNFDMHVVEFVGHWWVVNKSTNSVNTLHHPDCPCLKRQNVKPIEAEKVNLEF